MPLLSASALMAARELALAHPTRLTEALYLPILSGNVARQF
jgi:hypothetical protein